MATYEPWVMGLIEENERYRKHIMKDLLGRQKHREEIETEEFKEYGFSDSELEDMKKGIDKRIAELKELLGL